jgi:hypothetical protein
MSKLSVSDYATHVALLIVMGHVVNKLYMLIIIIHTYIHTHIHTHSLYPFPVS